MLLDNHSVTSFREFSLTWFTQNSILVKQFDHSNCRQQGEWIRFELEKTVGFGVENFTPLLSLVTPLR